MIGQDFDGDSAMETGIAGFVNFAHTARADARENFIRSETRADGQLLRLHGGLGEETRLSLFVRSDKGFHFPAQARFGASLVKIGRPLSGRPFQRVREHFLDFLPAFRCQGPSYLFNSRRNQARAVTHSRFTVAGEIPKTTAASSMESPPKNLSSMSRACCASKAASLARASSSATRSIPGA